MEQEFHRIKRLPPYVDYGVFTAIQVAATAALNGPQDGGAADAAGAARRLAS